MKNIVRTIKIFTSILITISILSATVPTYAQENDISKNNVIDITESSASNWGVSEAMTKEEMAQRFAQRNEISYIEAYQTLYPGELERSFSFPSIAPRAGTPNKTRELYVILNVTSLYKPILYFYCDTSESGNYWGIVDIYYITLYRKYQYRTKQFQGEINTWLRSPYQIEYLVNGDFYNNGTQTTSGGISGKFGIDQIATITIGLNGAYSSDHYAYFYEHKTEAFQ